jgi:hypothetical protein
MTIQEGDKQGADAQARLTIIHFIKECSRYPAYTEQVGAFMQQVCDDYFNRSLPRSWEQRITKQERRI